MIETFGATPFGCRALRELNRSTLCAPRVDFDRQHKKASVPMEITQLPTKLESEPLIEAVFELRFAPAGPVATILPGILFPVLSEPGAPLTVTRLPAAEFPEQMRAITPALKYAALILLDWGQFRILLGDSSIGVSCKLPYPGWAVFKPAILRVASLAEKSGVVGALDRYSLKYIDMIPRKTIQSQVAAIDWSVRVGRHTLVDEMASIRVEMRRDALTHIVQVSTSAQACDAVSGVIREGVVIDIDSVSSIGSLMFDKFLLQLPDRLDIIHQANKSVFFECLTREVLDELKPKYE